MWYVIEICQKGSQEAEYSQYTLFIIDTMLEFHIACKLITNGLNEIYKNNFIMAIWHWE